MHVNFSHVHKHVTASVMYVFHVRAPTSSLAASRRVVRHLLARRRPEAASAADCKVVLTRRRCVESEPPLEVLHRPGLLVYGGLAQRVGETWAAQCSADSVRSVA